MKKEGNAVVTGATTGIGRAISEALAGSGYDLWVCARSGDKLAAMQQSWAESFPGRRLRCVRADVGQQSEVGAFADIVREEAGSLRILVNNAGVFLPGSVLDEPDGALETMVNTNLYSAYWLTRALVPHMETGGRGYIFNICSIASITAYPNGGSYAISKHALLGFSKMLRAELMSRGIKVSAILPGATWSASWSGVDLPEERLMRATDVAEAVLAALRMSSSAVLEEIILRPQLGDL